MTQPKSTNLDSLPKAAREIALSTGAGGIVLRDVQDAMQLCKQVVDSGIGPVGLKTISQVFIALQTGLELGFSPMQALNAVYVVNGRAGLYGDAALAVIRSRNVCDWGPYVFTRGAGDALEGVFAFKRRDLSEKIEVTFSVSDAKRAGLWGKSGPWSSYPKTMLEWRAVGQGSKKYFSAELKGIPITEELQDYPAIEVHTLPQRPAAPDPLLSAGASDEASVIPTSTSGVDADAAGAAATPSSETTTGASQAPAGDGPPPPVQADDQVTPPADDLPEEHISDAQVEELAEVARVRAERLGKPDVWQELGTRVMRKFKYKSVRHVHPDDFQRVMAALMNAKLPT